MPCHADPPFKAAKSYLQRFPLLVAIKRKLWCVFNDSHADSDRTKLNLVATFPIYAPNSGGKYKDKANLTIETINQTIPLLSHFATLMSAKEIEITEIQHFPDSTEDLAAAKMLKQYLDKYGSDKADQYHRYHNVYGHILKRRDYIRGVLEIGLGTNNTDVVSNIGREGKSGASLRAFRDFLMNARIYGADIDRTILFEEERIKTYYVDQTDSESFHNLSTVIPSDLDLIIDDGLHSPSANINTLIFGLTKIKIGGWVVVEDIGCDAIPVWKLVAALLTSSYKPYLFNATGCLVFAVHRLG